MINSNENDTQLVLFLRDLANSIENEQLSPNNIQHVSEFFMNYKLCEADSNKSKEDNEEFDDMDIVKFFTLGWWIYRHMKI